MSPLETPSADPAASPAPTLKVSGGAEQGTLDLEAGLIELQPHAVSASAGGRIDASYLGDDCSGWVDRAADLQVSLFQPGPPLAPASLLRFYFISAGDTTLVVKFGQTSGWDRQWLCADDSYGTLHPTIDVVNPTAGNYKVWIGSADPGEHLAGTLYVTVVAANHP